MTIGSTSTCLISALAIAITLSVPLHAQTDPDTSRSPIVAQARETVKAVAAAAPHLKTASSAGLAPAPASTPAAPAASNSPSASAPTAQAASTSPAAAPSGAGASAAKAPVPVTTVAGTAIPAGAPVIIVQAAPAPQNPSGIVDSTANNWLGGLVGIALIGGIGYFGIRAAKSRGLTVEDGLKRLGIETQPAMPVGPAFAAMKPAPAPLPPLPSLANMPLAGPASASGLPMAGGATAHRTAALVGVAGPVSGERFDLEGISLPFSVGRDDVNSLALTGDTAISRRHAQIARSGSDWTVGDVGSSNGTFVNGARVKGNSRFGRATRYKLADHDSGLRGRDHFHE